MKVGEDGEGQGDERKESEDVTDNLKRRVWSCSMWRQRIQGQNHERARRRYDKDMDDQIDDDGDARSA